MQEERNIKITRIDRLVIRPGFPGRFHCVTFKGGSDGSVDSSFEVWVPTAYPEAEVGRVARACLSLRLLELAELAKASASAEVAIGGLRKTRGGNRSVRSEKRERQSSLQRTSRHLERAHIQLARYTLDGRHQPIPCDDLMMWKAWMNTSERWVENTLRSDPDNNQVRVSTVFLGLDVGFGGAERPIIFETMVLGGMCDRDLYRYCTWEEAKNGHAAILDYLQAHDRQRVKIPTLVMAWNLAHRTVQTSGQPVVKAFVEQCANHLGP